MPNASESVRGLSIEQAERANHEIDRLVAGQLAAWQGGRPDMQAVRAWLDHINSSYPPFFLLSIKGQSVTIIDPPEGPKAPLFYRDVRAEQYRAFIEDVVRTCGLDLDIFLGLDAHDISLLPTDGPIFTFQKEAGEKFILLPDPDFLKHGFYEDGEGRDDLALEDKSPRAVFAGSTTGGLITMDILDAGGVARINSALFFKGHPDVDFFLPEIVQCETDAVYSRVAALDVGGRKLDWQDQFGMKYLLSMDGNGCTCSRLLLALRSQSVLFKYDSSRVMYYFDCLEPWMHYVPIHKDQDVLDAMAVLNADPARAAKISADATAFHDRLLTRSAVVEYTSRLLQAYQALFFT